MSNENLISNKLKGVQDFENYLNHTFQPVTPSPDFVSRLNNQIRMDPPKIAGVRSALKVYILVVLGCGSGLFLFWLIRHLIRGKGGNLITE